MSYADDDDGEEPPEPVGYKRPPKEHRFRKGSSGNPRGRPRKLRKPPPILTLGRITAEIILNESTRMMQVRDNGKLEEMPALQAMVRSLHIRALNGDRRAAAESIKLAKAAEETIDREWMKIADDLIATRLNWDEALREAKAGGDRILEPVPHPYDMALDHQNMRLIFNGPKSQAEKTRWDGVLRRRADHVQEIEDILSGCPNRHVPDGLRDTLSSLVALIDQVDGLFPDERTRRQPDFDLKRWRAANGMRGKGLAQIKKPWSLRYWAKVKARRSKRT